MYVQMKTIEGGVVNHIGEVGPEDGDAVQAGGVDDGELALGVVAVPPRDPHT